MQERFCSGFSRFMGAVFLSDMYRASRDMRSWFLYQKLKEAAMSPESGLSTNQPYFFYVQEPRTRPGHRIKSNHADLLLLRILPPTPTLKANMTRAKLRTLGRRFFGDLEKISAPGGELLPFVEATDYFWKYELT